MELSDTPGKGYIQNILIFLFVLVEEICEKGYGCKGTLETIIHYT